MAKRPANTLETAFMGLAREEPRLLELLVDCLTLQETTADAPSFCANAVWFWGKAPLRDKLSRLAGWRAEKIKRPGARGRRDYDIAYRYLYAALPDCRSCGCACLEDFL